MDNAFNDKAEAGITGRIYNYEEKPEGCSIYLKDASVQLKGSRTLYSLPYILVYSKEKSCFSTGSQLEIYGTVYKPETPSNPGFFLTINHRFYLRKIYIIQLLQNQLLILEIQGTALFIVYVGLQEG